MSNSSLLEFRDWSHSLNVPCPSLLLHLLIRGLFRRLASHMHYDAKGYPPSYFNRELHSLIYAYVIWQWLILGIVPIERDKWFV